MLFLKYLIPVLVHSRLGIHFKEGNTMSTQSIVAGSDVWSRQLVFTFTRMVFLPVPRRKSALLHDAKYINNDKQTHPAEQRIH